MLRGIMLATLLCAALASVVTSNSSSAAPATVTPGPITLEDGLLAPDVDPRVVEAVAAYLDAVREGDAEAVSGMLDRRELYNRAADHLGVRLSTIERSAMSKAVLRPLLENHVAALAPALEGGTPRLRAVGSPADGVSTYALIVRAAADDVDVYVRLWLHEDDGAVAIADFAVEDALLLLSEQIAMMRKVVRLDSSDSGRFMAYSQTYMTALQLLGEGEARQALARLSAIEEDALSLFDPVADTHAFAVMQGATLVGDSQLAFERANGLTQRHPRAHLPHFIRGRSAYELGMDDEALASLAEYERLVGPDSSAQGVRGFVLLNRGAFDEAVEQFRGSLDANPNQVDVLVDFGVYAPREEHADVLAYYRAQHDPRANLEVLLSGWSDGGACDVVRFVSAALREEEDPDANAWYYEARCDLIDEDFDACCALIRAGAALAPSDEAAAYEDLWVRARYAAGEAVDAYRSSTDPAAAFRTTCDLALSDPIEPEVLQSLVNARAQDAPDDPWLPYYQGELFVAREDYESAETRFAAGMALAAGDEELLSTYRWSRAWSFYHAGRAVDAQRAMPDAETFALLVDWALWDDDGALLEELVAARREQAPDAPLLGFYAAKGALLQGRLEEGVDALHAGYDEWSRSDEVLQMLEYDLITGLIELERLDDALAIAKRSTDRDDDPYYELMVHVAAGSVMDAMRAFDTLVRIGYATEALYELQPGGEALRTDAAYTSLRELFPPPAR